MRFVIFLFVIFILSCGENPLSNKVEKLEARIDELEDQRQTDRLDLLNRIDQVFVTTDNVDEVSEIRSKLAQTDVSQTELLQLKTRLERLEQKVKDWSSVVSSVQRGIYIILHGVQIGDDWIISFVGTGFAVNNEAIVTNGHIVDGLLQLNKTVRDFSISWNYKNLSSQWIVVQNLTTSLFYKYNFFFIQTYYLHPKWNPADLSSPDVAKLTIREGRISRYVPVATVSEGLRLRVGQPVATLGFPGELQNRRLDNTSPIATFKNGTISALRPPVQGGSYSSRDTYVVQTQFKSIWWYKWQPYL